MILLIEFYFKKSSFSFPGTQRLQIYTVTIILEIWMLLETAKFLDAKY